MLPARKRLRADRDVRRAIRAGQRRNGTLLSILQRPDERSARFAFVISKKVSKLAVVRNRLRRQLREIVRPLPNLRGDFVVTARPAAVGKSFSTLQSELIRLLSTPNRAPRHR